MNTQSPTVQSRDRDRIRETGATGHTASADRPGTTRHTSRVGGARILRRWSVAELIARAGGAPRAFA